MHIKHPTDFVIVFPTTFERDDFFGIYKRTDDGFKIYQD